MAIYKVRAMLRGLLDRFSGWLYDKINNWCKRHQINLAPSVSRWSIFTVLLSVSLFFLSLFSTFLTLYITRPGDAWMLALVIVLGVGGISLILVAALFAYACIKRGSSDIQEEMQRQTVKSLKELVKTQKKMVKSLDTLVKRSKKG